MEESIAYLDENIDNMSPKRVSSLYSPLALAYIGDSIYDLLVKRYFVLASNMQPEKYHKRVIQIVSANAQAEFIEGYMDSLTDDERDVYRRGRNSSPHTKAKNASLDNYLRATGFEAVLGYLYLSGQYDRMKSIIDESINRVISI